MAGPRGSATWGRCRAVSPACVIVLAALMTGVPAAPAAAAAAPTCRGPAELANTFVLSAARKLTTQRTPCVVAKRVVTSFAKRCLGAYTAQGACTFKAIPARRWRCSSRLIGSSAADAPAIVNCRAGRRLVRFTVASVPLPEASVGEGFGAQATRIGGPYDATARCIDANTAGVEAVPPPAPPHDTFQIYAHGLVPLAFAAAVQEQMVSRDVAPKLRVGLGSLPRGYPQRVPIFLTTGANEGITSVLCDGSPRDGTVVAIGGGVAATAATAAHELGHVYSRGLQPAFGVLPWFEDSVNEWFKWKLGYYEPKPRIWDVHLQYPEKALDLVDLNEDSSDRHRYAMWRFVQFLDDKQLFSAPDGSWPLARAVTLGAPSFAATMDRVLTEGGTRLGQELAAFWGEHLKAQPKRPPRLVPSGVNSQRIEVAAGQTTFPATTCRLCTRLLDFTLAPDVKRVEFEFEPPADGYFWGLVAPNDSRRFEFGNSVAFCVGEDPGNEDPTWPGHFPVTFTNGLLADGDLTGAVKIFAQTASEQCRDAPANRACRILFAAGARSILGPHVIGDADGYAGVDADGRRYQGCGYTGRAGVGVLDIHRFRSSQELRTWIKRKHRVAGWRYVRFGDLAIAFSAPSGGHAFVQIAVGRERLSLSASSDSATSQVLRLAQGAMRHFR